MTFFGQFRFARARARERERESEEWDGTVIIFNIMRIKVWPLKS